jgi:hypothetical protein
MWLKFGYSSLLLLCHCYVNPHLKKYYENIETRIFNLIPFFTLWPQLFLIIMLVISNLIIDQCIFIIIQHNIIFCWNQFIWWWWILILFHIHTMDMGNCNSCICAKVYVCPVQQKTRLVVIRTRMLQIQVIFHLE